jgi:hypothetical protein
MAELQRRFRDRPKDSRWYGRGTNLTCDNDYIGVPRYQQKTMAQIDGAIVDLLSCHKKILIL